MMWRLRPLSLRVSLTIWYVAAMIVVLAIYAGAVFTFVNRNVSKGLDDRLRSDFQWAAEMAEQKPDGSLTWFEGGDGADEDGPWLQVWSPAGQLLFRTSIAKRNPLPESELLAAQANNRIVTVPTMWSAIRVLSGRSTVGGKPVVLQVARSEAQIRTDVNNLALILILGLPLGVAAAGLGGYSLARRALAPIHRMAERARSITAARLNDRLPIDNPSDELGQLASVFNDTLGRLELSFNQMRRFTADVSHEIRTPLTAIRTVGEVGLREARDPRSYQSIISSMLEEADRLSTLVDRLLTLSRAEAGLAKLSLEMVDIRALAEDVAAQLGVLAEEKRQSLILEPLGEPRSFADRLVLRQSLVNLVDNAIKHSPDGGAIRIRVSNANAAAYIDVCDSGSGIPADVQPRIFDRFFRATNEDAAGSGLGLAIAKWAVEANGGQLSLVKADDSGSTFRITLPSTATT